MEYKTVKSEATGEFIEKRSRFLCHVKPVSTNEEAVKFINEKKSKYWDATHNVYAYILREGGIMRYSDDGEPQGTAGQPALEVLRREELYDLVVVITRYFGGIMLGAGGLVRAYARGAKEAVEAGGVALMCLCRDFELKIEYAQYEQTKKTLEAMGAVIADTEYADKVTIKYYVKKSEEDKLSHALTELTNGAASPKALKERFMPI
ncbi:MAG: YigZ family protein [Clostridia bacterium]|nr:YigZ family protein [Clostridia bacterium]MBQ7624927.1 YigZ family protein [Clostridia bacterium]